MHPCTDLYPQICDWENLERAYRRARRGKRGRAPAADFERKLEDNLVALAPSPRPRGRAALAWTRAVSQAMLAQAAVLGGGYRT